MLCRSGLYSRPCISSRCQLVLLLLCLIKLSTVCCDSQQCHDSSPVS